MPIQMSFFNFQHTTVVDSPATDCYGATDLYDLANDSFTSQNQITSCTKEKEKVSVIDKHRSVIADLPIKV
jgi:hypothetical protein